MSSARGRSTGPCWSASCSCGARRGTLLVDGMLRATWQIVRQGPAATLHVEPFARLARADGAAVEQEGARVLAFAVAGADPRDVRIAQPR